ncbi:MAPEG family protein [Aurantiacibacter sp. D1-12]|uniref:MAPEG family protein n=1 Tax=Aurantiacibacter sp. D1-12 TaxID=2993658 RepID=UPI00237D2897|nr:MAPEG family protein [Aurantiacibacter sp. D1-12]MDE1467078.1 MAPEG family protein [Aurantiacibacter sp. D1-12]
MEVAIPVTTAFVSLSAIVVFALTGWIGVRRGATDILRGHGGDEVLQKRVRIHGNFVENAPITALVVGAAEVMGMSKDWLWIAVFSFLAGRILHYLLYDRKIRAAGMLLTQAPALLIGLWLLLRLV